MSELNRFARNITFQYYSEYVALVTKALQGVQCQMYDALHDQFELFSLLSNSNTLLCLKVIK